MVVAPEMLPGISGHQINIVLLGEGLVVVGVELEGGVATGVIVIRMGTAT